MQGYWVWLDGRVMAPEAACVSVLDHGFLYGDSVYETLRSHGGRLFAVADHLERLHDSAAAIGLSLPWDDAALERALEETAGARPAGREACLRLVVSRGVGPITLDIEPCVAPRLVVFGWSIDSGPHPSFAAGIRAAITAVRRNPPSALDPRIKSGNFLNNILAFREAKQRGAQEGILLSTDGFVAEGTTSNVFWVRDGAVSTPDEHGILPGVTRKHLLHLFDRERIPYAVGRYRPAELTSAGEVFITSTLRAVMPVVELDGRPVGAGRCGALTARIADLYDKMVQATFESGAATSRR